MSVFEKAALLSVRVIGFIFLVVGFWAIVTAFAQSWDQLNYIYLNVFFLGQVVPGITAFVWGIVLLILAKPLARFLSRGL